MLHKNMFGGIEAGGTKFICALTSEPPRLEHQVTFSTTDPSSTLEQVRLFFEPFIQQGMVASIGLAAFGPVEVNPFSPTYGYITATPKPGWRDTNILGELQRHLGVPFVFHLDVSGSAIGEHTWGASRGIDPSLYLTVGTGIGGAYLLNGAPLSGLAAVEMGHIRIPHDRLKDPFEGSCPYHRDCFEGLAAGPAITARFGKRGEDLTDEDPFWLLEVEYIASALTNLILTLSPRIIVLGGGIMQRSFLYPLIRSRVTELLNGYVREDAILSGMDDYIIPPALGRYSGVLGAIAMAMGLGNPQPALGYS
ncbi:MAG TPA: ROK family protein [Anaerolineaceae bacterium]|nr:ROK family protein [Anaerolineaceae bacterium]